MELKLSLATILSNYELDLASQKPEKLKRRGVTLAPGAGVQIIVKGKRTPSIAIYFQTKSNSLILWLGFKLHLTNRQWE